MTRFALHATLAADCIPLGNWPLSQLLMMNEARYPWFILVPRRADLRELCELSTDDTRQFWIESKRLSQFLLQAFAADKLNVAALGNQVPQLHVHHIARFTSDPAWPHPVWGRLPGQALDDETLRTRRSLVMNQLTDLQPIP